MVESWQCSVYDDNWEVTCSLQQHGRGSKGCLVKPW